MSSESVQTFEPGGHKSDAINFKRYQGLQAYKIIYAQDMTSHMHPTRLQSLSRPIHTTVWLLTAIAIMAIALTMKLIGWTASHLKRERDESFNWQTILLTILSTFVSQNFQSKLGELLRWFYMTWVIAILFLIAAYNEVVESLTTVPQVYNADLTLEDLIAMNFSTGIVSWHEYNQILKNAPRDRMELELTRQMHGNAPTREPGLQEIVEFWKRPRPMHVVNGLSSLRYFQIVLSRLGRNMFLSRENVFAKQIWWSFDNMPNSDVVVETFGRLRDAGIELHWEKVYHDGQSARMERMLQTEDDLLLPYASVEDSDGNLSDSLVRESFCLLVYGMITACLALVWEFRRSIIQGVRQKIRKFQCVLLSLIIGLFL